MRKDWRWARKATCDAAEAVWKADGDRLDADASLKEKRNFPLSQRAYGRLLIQWFQAVVVYRCYPETEKWRTRLANELKDYAKNEADHQGQLPPAPPLPLPPLPHEDALTLFPALSGSALYTDIVVGKWTQRVLIDTGATNLTVTESLAQRLLAQGIAHQGSGVTTKLADGSTREGRTIIIDRVTIGSHVLRDVEAGVTPDGADMLLGLPLLNQIGRFTIDADRHKLIFG